MSWELIKIIIMLGCLLLTVGTMAYNKITKKKLNSNQDLVRLGVDCYGCKVFIDKEPFIDYLNRSPKLWMHDYINEKKRWQLCTSCKRERTFAKLNNSILHEFILTTKKFIYSDKCNIAQAYASAIYLILLGCYACSRNDLFFISFNIVILMTWVINMIQTKLYYNEH